MLFGAPFFWAAGSEIFDKDLNLVFDSDATPRRSNSTRACTSTPRKPATGFAWGDMINAFLAGQSAMTIYLGRVLGRVYTGAPQLVGKVQAIAYPKNKIQVTADDPNYYVINAKTAYPEQVQALAGVYPDHPLPVSTSCAASRATCRLPPRTRRSGGTRPRRDARSWTRTPIVKKVMGDAMAYAYNPYPELRRHPRSLEAGQGSLRAHRLAESPRPSPPKGRSKTYALGDPERGRRRRCRSAMPSRPSLQPTQAAVDVLKKEIGWV